MKLGLVVDGGHWGFIRELLADWESRYRTDIFSFHEIKTPLWRGRTNEWRLRRALAQFLEQNDVVFFEWAGPYLVIASHLRVKARLVVRLHSYELFDYAPHIRWDAVERIVLVSEAMRRHFCQRFPDAAAKTRVVNNGVDLTRFNVSAKRTFGGVMGMLGNLIPIKRVYQVILALYELNQTGNRLQLRLGGVPDTGADAERYMLAMQRLVRQLGLEPQVCFVGKVTDAPEFLNSIDIFISNSYWEGQQVALLEAMASGCYCLSHHWDGADEILPPENLFMTDRELQEKIMRYCALPPSAKLQAHQTMRALACAKFDGERMKAQLADIVAKRE